MIVTIADYDTSWPLKFEEEARTLRLLLGSTVRAIHHIGSTAVPGMKAKPIIDIILEVDTLSSLDAKCNKLESVGYEGKGEFGILGRRYFRKGGDNRTHHLHAYQADDANIIRHLVFRDYLIEHPDIAELYGERKSLIAKACINSDVSYYDAKSAFVKFYESEALQWYAQRSPFKI